MTKDSAEPRTGEGGLLVATFLLGESAFGIDTALVQEVVVAGELTAVHHAPSYVAGIRNLRGRIVTVIDLKVRLDLGCVAAGPEARILIVDWKGEPVGLLVDRVADTVALDTGALETAPPNLHGVQSRDLRGVFRGGGRLVALLDPAAVLEPDSAVGPTVQEGVEKTS
ncbi:MAG: chemotaxis protein CheW [bacterium]